MDMQTEVEVTDLIALNEAARNLRLDVGKPHEKGLVDGRSELVVVRDELGLSYDPKVHAKKRCSACRGNGVIQGRRAVKAPGKRSKNNWEHFSHSCVCAKRGYQRARKKLYEAYHTLLLVKD
jgi:hypothetical protein